MSRRGLVLGGAIVAGGASYYLYQAGGDTKVAQKKIEDDAARLSDQVKGELPGKGKEIKKDAELGASKVGSQVDSAVNSARNQLNQASKDAEKKFEDARKEAGSGLNKAVDKFDQTVTDGASKAKSGISSWFGGK